MTDPISDFDSDAFARGMLTGSRMKRWLEHCWPPRWRVEEPRTFYPDDIEGRGWAVPDFDAGRSRVLVVEREILESKSVEQIVARLEESNWLERIGSEGLAVVACAGDIEVHTWNGDPQEQWFHDDEWGNLLIYADWVGGVGVGYIPEPARKILVVHAKNWAAAGPENPRDPKQYTLDELRPHILRARGLA